jgi:hypothetical protein
MKDDPDDCVIFLHSNSTIKPTLDEHHRFAKVLFASANMNLEILKGITTIMIMLAHVDEKWLFLMEAELSMYTMPGEAPPNRSTQHKSHIWKVMFLATVARPRYNGAGDCNKRTLECQNSN